MSIWTCHYHRHLRERYHSTGEMHSMDLRRLVQYEYERGRHFKYFALVLLALVAVLCWIIGL